MELLRDVFLAGLAYYAVCFLHAFGHTDSFVCMWCLLVQAHRGQVFFGFVFLLKMAQMICLWMISQELLIWLSLCARDYRNMTEKILLMCVIYISV